MGRKYGLGKYGAGTYDLQATHTIVNLVGNPIVVNIAVNSATLHSEHHLMGTIIIRIGLTGAIGHNINLVGQINTNFVVQSNSEFIGPFWIPDIPDNWFDVPEGWTPTTVPIIPCRTPSWPT